MEGADVSPRAVVQLDAVGGVPAGTTVDPKGGERLARSARPGDRPTAPASVRTRGDLMHPSIQPSRTFARRTLLALLALTFGGAAFAQPVQIEFWHGFTGALGETLEGYVADFNASQDQYQVNPSYKGTYNETMVAAIAAFRSGTAPHIVQMFEVGTATMMYSGGAIMPVHQLFADTGVPFDPERYIAAIRGYYSNAEGQMMSMPFNSSTTIMWVNNDALIAAGLDPATTSLKYWDEVRAVAKQVVDSGAATCGLSFAWPSWSQFENFSAMHDVPLATEMNGMAGLGAELQINSPLHVAHVTMLAEMVAEGSATYGGRGNAADALFPSGECAIVQASSGLLARVNREATFAWSAHFLPVHQEFRADPQNSIIGGASLWVMQSPTRTVEEYRAVAEFFNYLAQPEIAEKWHLDTGYLPIVNGVYEKLEAEGYYAERPGLAVPYLQLTNQPPTENSRGLQLGNMPEIRDIIEEELELVLQGQKTAQAALDSAVERGNVVLRNFERANR
jgi:sn-glycerol 3-phosphate transport system substrate-binding protein